MSERWKLDRRHFLEVGAAVTGGLVFGVYARSPRAPATRAASADAFVPNVFIQIDRDDTVTITVSRPDMGQGVRTTLPLIIADELDADWKTVRVAQADAGDRYGVGEQYAGGSNSVAHSWLPYRRAGALARELLIQAAAGRWGVSRAGCEARGGAVLHAATGRRARFGELVDAARGLPLPADVRLKEPQMFRLIGTRVPGLDAPAIVRGAVRFGLDTRVPGMLYAVVERSPVFGGRIQHVGSERALAMPGVRRVVSIDADRLPAFGANSPKPPNGVAVVADSTWAALQGRRALGVSWEAGPGVAESSAALRAQCAGLGERPPERIIRLDGDPDAALAHAAHTLEAVYELPFLAHAPLEPMNCTAHALAERCEVWAPTQNPEGARHVVQAITGLPTDAITVHVTRMGGGFGRRFYADFVAEAVLVSRAVGAPVQVVWTREDDLRHGFYRPASYNVLRGGIDASGRPIVWTHHLVNAARGEYLNWTLPPGATVFPAGDELGQDDFPAGFIPNFRLSGSAVHSRIPRGQWRSVDESSNVFVYQSFVDELAHLGGHDPLALRLELLGAPRDMPYDNRRYSTGRLRAVFELAAARAGWGTPLPTGRGRGIAGCYANKAYVAEVAEVSVGATGLVRVHRVVAAVDCGRVINPAGAEAQVEGAIAYGLSAALGEEITVEQGAVQQSTFTDYPVLRMDRMPAVEIHFIPGAETPLGIGEPALPPIAPAVCNAIFAATGKRIRKLPIGTLA